MPCCVCLLCVLTSEDYKDVICSVSILDVDVLDFDVLDVDVLDVDVLDVAGR